MDWIQLTQFPEMGICERGNDSSGSIKEVNFLTN
jgi:hypothetical protein